MAMRDQGKSIREFILCGFYPDDYWDSYLSRFMRAQEESKDTFQLLFGTCPVLREDFSISEVVF
jgi:hypothetical protein